MIESCANLHCHPAQACSVIHSLSADADWLADGRVRVRFRMRARLSALRLPSVPLADDHAVGRLPGFADNLWQHTCFEAFVSIGDAAQKAYREFNFSPDGHWAAYDFVDYRQRNNEWQPAQAPRIEVSSTPDGLDLAATLPACVIPGDTQCVLHIGLTAVIESADGTLSYWALAHTEERPDFHQRQSFVFRLAR